MSRTAKARRLCWSVPAWGRKPAVPLVAIIVIVVLFEAMVLGRATTALSTLLAAFLVAAVNDVVRGGTRRWARAR